MKAFKLFPKQQFALLLAVAIIAAPAFAQRDQNKAASVGPKVEITEIPAYDCGGPDRLDSIAGKVTGIKPGDYRLIIYSFACNGVGYLQPTLAAPFTHIEPDNTFNAYIHLGQTYYVLLVTPNFKPKPELSQVPSAGGDIIAVGKIRGRGAPDDSAKKK